MNREKTLEVTDADQVSPEKGSTILYIDNIQVVGLDPNDAEFYTAFPIERRKRLIRKVDIRLVPMLAVLYLISHLDRANIGNAKIEGLLEDLGMDGLQYNIALALFFIPYVLLEVPSNVLLKNFSRPSVYLGILITSWGIIMTLTGVVQGFGGLVAVRVLLGVFEAGFFPGAVYLCTFWYMPKDLASRLAFFYCASSISGAFSGLLAAAIAKMNGVGGYAGWRWIFIIEGLATIVLGICCFFLLIDSPRLSTRWLDEEEIRFLELQRLVKEGGVSREEEGEQKKFKWKDLGGVLATWRLYVQAFFLFCQSACSYGTKFTMPSITKAMGFSNTNAQLMTVPPYIAGGLSAIFFSILSDRFYWRMPFVAIPVTIVIIGYSIIISFDGALEANVGPSFFAVILTCIGIFPMQPATASWAANNLAPTKRRAIGLALAICIGNTGGIIGSFMYLDSEAPQYYTGFGLSLALAGVALLLVLFLELTFIWANRRKEKVSETEVRERFSEQQLLELGDRSPMFKYTL